MAVKYSDETVDKCMIVIDVYTRAGELWSLDDIANLVGIHYTAAREIVNVELISGCVVRKLVAACWTGGGRLPALYAMRFDFADHCDDDELRDGVKVSHDRADEEKAYRAKYTWQK